MDKPRILILENSRVTTGALKAIITSSSCLKELFYFQFIVPPGSAGQSLNEGGFHDVHRWTMIEISKRLSAILFYFPRLVINAFKLKRHVGKNNIDLIHVNDLYNLIPAVATMIGCRVPYICHVRFMPGAFPGFLFRAWFRIHLRYAKKMIVVSEALRRAIPGHEKIEVVYDGMKFNADGTKSSAELVRNVFLYLGSMIPGKGQDLALDAFLRVHELLPEWKLRFVGGDNGLEKNRRFLDSLKQKARAMAIDDKVEWEGFIDDVEREYRGAAIVLNFSESESFSMAALEALSFGRPLIVSDCGGPAELVNNGVTGILVPNRDVDSMVRAMIDLASSPERREQLGRNASLDMRSRFDAKITSRKMMEVYRNCVSGI